MPPDAGTAYTAARDVGVIIVAAGRGVRAGGEMPKQYRPIGGVPMVLRALRPFAAHPAVGAVVLVLPPADAAAPPEWLAPHLSATLLVAPGGAERGDSVVAGLARLPEGCRLVLVHDAARPFVETRTIDAVITAARGGAAAVAAVPMADTLKEACVDAPDLVKRTVPREGLWRAQTPQGFSRPLLERAHAEARARGTVATDDAALVEPLGVPIRLVPDSTRNLKITTAEDFLLAELLAREAR